MFEIVVTYRPDFVEQALDRFPTIDEARAVAARLAVEYREQVVRIWVRQVREAKTQK
jgi:hypothetical protein